MGFGVVRADMTDGLASRSVFLYNHGLAEERCKVVAQTPQARHPETTPAQTAFT